MLNAVDCSSVSFTTDCCLPFIRRFSPFCRMVDVSPLEPQVYFTIGASYKNPALLTFSDTRVYLELRRKGNECLIATYNVWRRDANGAIGFYFDASLFDQPPGYFIGDVYLNCVYCFSVQLRLASCEAYPIDCYAIPLEARSSCENAASIGEDSIGGNTCPITPEESCGPVPPYFPINNPLPPTPEPPVPSTCIFTADSIGGAAIG